MQSKDLCLMLSDHFRNLAYSLEQEQTDMKNQINRLQAQLDMEADRNYTFKKNLKDLLEEEIKR